jgi:phosphoribosylformylglycinamidine (FGAM) synthase-like amidotransferase family enzyme
VLPGGVINPDHLRMDPNAITFVRQFVASGKPVAAICHGPWTLLEAGALRGKKVTSWPSLKTDLKNAGANWVDQQVVTDGQFIFSRKPDDIPAFSKAIIDSLSDGAVSTEQERIASTAKAETGSHAQRACKARSFNEAAGFLRAPLHLKTLKF